MNKTNTTSLIHHSLKNSLHLSLFAILTAGIIGITWQITKQPIAEQIMISQQKALNAVLPSHYYNNLLIKHPISLPEPELLSLNSKNTEKGYLATYNNKPTAVILPVSTSLGYSGTIKLLVGILFEDNRISGVQIIHHTETPGLGDAIEPAKSDWLQQFIDQSFNKTPINNWKPLKDKGKFDQITGATVTSRAVISALKIALEYFEKHKESLTQKSLNIKGLT